MCKTKTPTAVVDSITQIPCAVNLRAVVPAFKRMSRIKALKYHIGDLKEIIFTQERVIEELQKELEEYRQYCGG